MKPNSVSELIDLWPTISAFANELGCGYEAARKMRARNSVASKYWGDLVSICQRNGKADISYAWLVAHCTDYDESERTGA